jgi:hypothetical protein
MDELDSLFLLSSCASYTLRSFRSFRRNQKAVSLSEAPIPYRSKQAHSAFLCCLAPAPNLSVVSLLTMKPKSGFPVRSSNASQDWTVAPSFLLFIIYFFEFGVYDVVVFFVLAFSLAALRCLLSLLIQFHC